MIAPALVPRRAGVRVKTDGPSPAEEALRDLIRTREDFKADRRIARQRLRSFLLRHGRAYPKGSGTWTRPHRQWLSAQAFGEPTADATWRHLLAAHAVRASQLDALDAEIAAAAAAEPLAAPVARLRCFRGIATLSAATIVAETCDFARFPTAASFMAFTGLVPSEHSSGVSSRHGSITKTGNRHIRRVLVEAACSYRHGPAVGRELARRLEGQPPEVAAYSWAAQCRLHGTYRKLAPVKGPNKAVVAVARELSGFVWGLMTERIAA